ncbi:hemolysin family protein [Timonella sp. A28]|uniref:hemolysin family protein n=1 Tax=Timonella sp. A28 TaxID=3442640 RepID=UPI003EB69CC1
MGDWLFVLGGVLLTVGTAIFVAAEFSLVTIDSATLGDDEENGSPHAKGGWRVRVLRRSLKHLSTELSSSQVGITVTTILLGYTTQPAVVRLISDGLGNTALTSATASVIAGILAFFAVNLFSMLFGELIPKNFALSAPLGTAKIVVPLQRIFTVLAKPVITALNGSANAILRRMGIEPKEELSGARSTTELAYLVQRSAEQGTLDVSVAQLITNAVDFEELTAVDVMTDRMRMSVVSREDTAHDVIQLARATGHSRFPVIGDSRDDVVGLVHLRKAISVPYDKRDAVPAMALVDEAPQVPETVRLGPLLVDLREFGMQMAVVVDEYGGTSGIVTLEDVVEELVGDVADEHDSRRSGVLLASDGTWGVPGLLRPDELHERTKISLPEDPSYETLGGLVMKELGQVPKVGDSVRVVSEFDARVVVLTVELMDGRRIDRLRVKVEQSS